MYVFFLFKRSDDDGCYKLSAGRYHDTRERNRFCIEDPFETDYNVARCVTKDGLYTVRPPVRMPVLTGLHPFQIRGEFMRASRILASRPERAWLALAELCEERKADDLVSAPPHAGSRLSNPPPQTPFPVGSQSMQANRVPSPGRLSPTVPPAEPTNGSPVPDVPERPVPEHMAPTRSKWTSPPPPEAPSDDHALFDTQLGKGIQVATASSDAREKDSTSNSSSSNSEIITDEDRSDAAESDDITSVQSFTEGTNIVNGATPVRRPSWHVQDGAVRIPQINTRDGNVLPEINSSHPPRYNTTGGGRTRYTRDKATDVTQRFLRDFQVMSSSRAGAMKRQIPGSSRGIQGPTTSWSPMLSSSISSSPASIPLPSSPDLIDSTTDSATTVYYQTTRSPRPTSVLYPGSPSGSPHLLSPHNIFLSQFHQQHQQPQALYLNNVPQDIFPPNMPPVITSTISSPNPCGTLGRGFQPKYHAAETSRRGLDTPTPTSQDRHSPRHTYNQPHTLAHSHSVTTVTPPTPPPSHSPVITPAAMRFSVQVRSSSPLTRAADVYNRDMHSSPRQPSSPLISSSPRIHSYSPTPSQTQTTVTQTPARSSAAPNGKANLASPQPFSSISNESSPALSAGTGYGSSTSRSPSPHSPRSPQTAVPVNRVMEFLIAAGKREGGGQENENVMFGSFASLEVRDENQRTLQNLNRHRLPRHSHHLVTADPAVLEVSPTVVAHHAPETSQ